MSDRQWTVVGAAMTCLTGFAGLLAFLYPRQRGLLIVLAIIFLFGAVFCFAKLIQEHWRTRVPQRKVDKQWSTAKRLEITLVAGSVTLDGMHSFAPGTPNWPTLTALKGKATIEVLNHYRRPVKLQRIWIEVFEPASGIEILPQVVTKLVIDSGVSEIKAGGKQTYKVEMISRFDKWIKADGVEAFVIVETTSRTWRRARINDVVSS
jgi:hypothetical protein